MSQQLRAECTIGDATSRSCLPAPEVPASPEPQERDDRGRKSRKPSRRQPLSRPQTASRASPGDADVPTAVLRVHAPPALLCGHSPVALEWTSSLNSFTFFVLNTLLSGIGFFAVVVVVVFSQCQIQRGAQSPYALLSFPLNFLRRHSKEMVKAIPHSDQAERPSVPLLGASLPL